MITLSAAIQSLRDELADAAAQLGNNDKGVRLTVEEAEVELELVLTKELRGSAEVNVWMVKVGAGGSGGTENSHRVRVKLKPLARDGGPLDVGSRDRLPTPPPPGDPE